MENIDELREIVAQALESKGVLSKLRVRLARNALFKSSSPRVSFANDTISMFRCLFPSPSFP